MKRIAIVALLCAFVATPALADNTGKSYVAGDYGSVTFSNSNPGGTDLPNPKALRISGGYHFSPTIAVEAGYAMIGDSTLTWPTASVTVKNSAVQAAAVGTFPVGAAFDLFVKLGLSMNSSKQIGTGTLAALNTNNSSTALLYGIGAQYNFDQQISIRAQYENFGKFKSTNLTPVTWDVGITLISFGVVSNF